MLDRLGVVLVYAGLGTTLVGIVTLLRPIRFLRIGNRRPAAIVLGMGVLLVLGGALLPAPIRQSTGQALIDGVIPRYQFSEFHETRVHATPDRVFHALREVTPEEIRLFQTLTWIRSPRLPGRAMPETILTAPAAKPILDVALSSGFMMLAEEMDRELVVGTIVCCRPVSRIKTPEDFINLNEPAIVKAIMNFRLEDEGFGRTRLTTETRVFANDAAGARAFRAYWRVIYPGSALIRRMWLRAVKERAER